MDDRRALPETSGDETKAKRFEKAKGEAAVAKRSGNLEKVRLKLMFTPVVKLERWFIWLRDRFVAKTEECKKLAPKELAMQVAAMNPYEYR